MAAKKVLGKGLNALFSAQSSTKERGEPAVLAAESVSRTIVQDIDVEKIKPNRHQPRTDFSDEALADLADSIKMHGVAQPLIVTKTAEAGQFELVVGERRLRASKKAGLKTVPCLVKSFSNQKRFEVALIENIQREDLNSLEEALAVDGLMKEYGLTQEKVATALGKSRSAVANILRFLRLHDAVQEALRLGNISDGHAKCLAGVSEHALQLNFLEKILKNNWTVRELEDYISQSPSKKKNTKSGKVQNSPETKKIEEDLQRLLGRRVEIQSKGKKGWIRFAFYSPWDLDVLLKRLGVKDGTPDSQDENQP